MVYSPNWQISNSKHGKNAVNDGHGGSWQEYDYNPNVVNQPNTLSQTTRTGVGLGEGYTGTILMYSSSSSSSESGGSSSSSSSSFSISCSSSSSSSFSSCSSSSFSSSSSSSFSSSSSSSFSSSSSSSSADTSNDFYWVYPLANVDYGDWGDAANWANTSGGTGGYGVPSTINHNAFFDQYSGNCSLTINININNFTVNGYTKTIDNNSSANIINGDFYFNGGSFIDTFGGVFGFYKNVQFISYVDLNLTSAIIYFGNNNSGGGIIDIDSYISDGLFSANTTYEIRNLNIANSLSISDIDSNLNFLSDHTFHINYFENIVGNISSTNPGISQFNLVIYTDCTTNGATIGDCNVVAGDYSVTCINSVNAGNNTGPIFFV